MPTSSLMLAVYDGTRKLFPQRKDILVTITDGNGQQIVRQDFKVSAIHFVLPFYDNLGDNYTVVAYADGYKQAGYAPVKLSPAVVTNLDLMLIPSDPQYNFAGLDWKAIQRLMPFLAAVDEEGDGAAETRFNELEENAPRSLACMLNLVAAMRGIALDDKCPVDFLRQVRWDFVMPAQDRFFAYCDEGLVQAVRDAAARGEFVPEYGAGLLHPGATLSWKQVAFQDANVQLTFHTNPLDCVPGKSWVTVEPDIDYYKDAGAHALLEVAYNAVTSSVTDPGDVYVMRWIESQRRGLPAFDPGYTIR